MTGQQGVVGGRYVLGGLLGRGGMAQVHRARDERLDREVAVKLLSAHLAADPTAQLRFRREAQAAASLNHPAIASVFDTGEDTDPTTQTSVPFIVMELVEGQTLRQVLADGPLPPPRALAITSSVLDALAHSHAAGIVHRDVKPANVMITPAGAVKVMDFGIARAVDDTSTSLTQTAAVIGTAQYLSPEQAAGKSVDQRSDLYAVGCLLYELLVGRPPFVGESSISIAYQHVREVPLPPSRLDPAITPALDALVLHALAKDPDQRYPTAAAMRTDVDALLVDPALPSAAVPVAAAALPATALAAAPVPEDTLGPTVLRPTTPPPPAALPVTGSVAAVAEPPRRSGAGRAALVAVAVFLLLGLGAFGLFRLLSPGTDPGAAAATVEVPNVLGSTRDEAGTTLEDADLVPRFEKVRGKAGDSVGTVVRQVPVGGSELASGATVTLGINVGPATAKVPDGLVGEDVDEARKDLRAAGFTSVEVEEVPSRSGDDQRGEVLAVTPAEGRSVAPDEDVVLRYASGRTAAASSSAPSDSDDSGDGDGPATSPTSAPPTRAPSPTPQPSSERPTTSAPPAPTATATSEATRATGKPSTPEKPEKPEPTTTNKGRGGSED